MTPARVSMVALALALSAGCGDQDLRPHRPAQLGDDCSRTNDCDSGLSCHDGVCLAADYPIEPSSAVCVAVPTCSVDGDCAEYAAERCVGGSCRFFCSQHSDCAYAEDFFATTCDGPTGRCHETCAVDDDCEGLSPLCDSSRGLCVDCIDDAGCATPRRCESGRCEDGCRVDADCGALEECAENQCEHVGCRGDDDCVFWTSNPSSACVTESGQCFVPCATDVECNADGFDFQACDGGRCVHIGCVANAECRAERGPGWECVESLP